MHNVYKKNNKLVIETIIGSSKVVLFEFPLKQDIINPYTDKKEGTMDNITGVIAGDEIGFSHLIDRSYKDKGPDISEFFYLYDGKETSFVRLCKKLKIDIYRFPICGECKEVIYGPSTWKDGKDLCFKCSKEYE